MLCHSAWTVQQLMLGHGAWTVMPWGDPMSLCLDRTAIDAVRPERSLGRAEGRGQLPQSLRPIPFQHLQLTL